MNILNTVKKNAIITLINNEVSQREISRKTGIHRKTIRKYAHLIKELPKQSLGAKNIENEKNNIQNAPGWPPIGSVSKTPKPNPELRSACESYRNWIEEQVRLKRNSMSIYQDLVERYGFVHAYNSVKRFVRKLKHTDPEQFDHLEFAPGEEAQKESTLRRKIKSAHFPEITTLEDFEWDFNPQIERVKIEELATLDFVKQKQIALFLGSPGTGKTHIALALGLKAIRKNLRVYCTSIKRFAQQIRLSKTKNSLDYLFKKILLSNLLIIDDWGVVSLDREIAEEVFDLLDRRRYSTAMLLTSNRAVEGWGEVFSDSVFLLKQR